MTDWNKLATDAEVVRTAENLESRGINVVVVQDKKEALDKLIAMIPAQAEVMTGSSTTLNEIGFSEYLNSPKSKFKNLSNSIWSENDEVKRNLLRRKAVSTDYHVSSVNAISANGEIVAVDNTGSRVGAIPFGAGKVIIVAGTNKITENLEAAMKRIREYVFPLEDKRASEAYGHGSNMSKWIIIEKEVTPDRITVILVKETLGF